MLLPRQDSKPGSRGRPLTVTSTDLSYRAIFSVVCEWRAAENGRRRGRTLAQKGVSCNEQKGVARENLRSRYGAPRRVYMSELKLRPPKNQNNKLHGRKIASLCELVLARHTRHLARLPDTNRRDAQSAEGGRYKDNAKFETKRRNRGRFASPLGNTGRGRRPLQKHRQMPPGPMPGRNESRRANC